MTTVQKLRIKSGDTIRLIATPVDYRDRLGELPEDVMFVDTKQEGAPTAIHWLVSSISDLESNFPRLLHKLQATERVWIVYARKTKYKEGDANRDTIWQYLQDQGWKAVANYPIDKDYSVAWAKPLS